MFLNMSVSSFDLITIIAERDIRSTKLVDRYLFISCNMKMMLYLLTKLIRGKIK